MHHGRSFSSRKFSPVHVNWNSGNHLKICLFDQLCLGGPGYSRGTENTNAVYYEKIWYLCVLAL